MEHEDNNLPDFMSGYKKIMLEVCYPEVSEFLGNSKWEPIEIYDTQNGIVKNNLNFFWMILLLKTLIDPTFGIIQIIWRNLKICIIQQEKIPEYCEEYWAYKKQSDLYVLKQKMFEKNIIFLYKARRKIL